METTARILKELSEGIGPRFSASDGEHAAARLLSTEFTAAGLDTRLQRLSFIGWEATSDPRLQVLGSNAREIVVAPVVYSAPAANVQGRLARLGQRSLIEGLYEMDTIAVLGEEETPVAVLVVNPRGGAIPLINPRPLYRMPQFVLSQEDAEALLEQVDAGDDVRVQLEFSSELDPEAYSFNVVAQYRGDPTTDDHIVVCAHYDTQIGSPGAYDNASGTAGMFAILEHLQAKALSVNVTFIGIAGEEVGMFGSEYYVNDLVERGELESVRYCVCLDQISGGDFFWLWCTDPDLRARGLDAIAAAGIAEVGPVEVDDNKPGADHWAFHARGVPACLLMWWRQEDYHRASDTFEKVDLDRVRVAVDAACHLIDTLADDLASS